MNLDRSVQMEFQSYIRNMGLSRLYTQSECIVLSWLFSQYRNTGKHLVADVNHVYKYRIL